MANLIRGAISDARRIVKGEESELSKSLMEKIGKAKKSVTTPKADTSAIDEEKKKRENIAASLKARQESALAGPAPEKIVTEDITAPAPVSAQGAGQTQAERIARGDVRNVATPSPVGSREIQGGTVQGRSVQGRSVTAADVAANQEGRVAQSDLIKALQARAAGTAPSIAENQLRQSQENILKQQAAQAAGTRGVGQALRQRELARAGGEAQQAAAQQAAQLRLQEQVQAEGAIADVAGTTRQQDIATAIEQARLQQAAGTTTAQLGQAADTTTAQLGQEAATTTAQLGQQAALASAEMAQRAEVSNAENSLRADLANQGVDLDVVKQNAAAGNTAAIANLSAITQAADRQLRADLANQNIDLDVLKTNAIRGDNAAVQNIDAALRQAGMDNQMIIAFLQAEVGLSSTDAQTATARSAAINQAAQAQAAGNRQLIGTGLSALGQVGASVI